MKTEADYIREWKEQNPGKAEEIGYRNYEKYNERMVAQRKRHRAAHPVDQKQYFRENYIHTVRGHIRGKKRPRPDDICELCNAKVTVLHYHHYDDDLTEYGIWVCRPCHRFVEAVDSGDVQERLSKYTELKRSVGMELLTILDTISLKNV